MQILLRTDNHIEGSAKLTNYVENLVRDALDQFERRITRVEVHLGDHNSHKSGEKDKRCSMEVRIGGIAPINVTAEAPTVGQALDGAIEKMEKTLRRTLGKLDATRNRASLSDIAPVGEAVASEVPVGDDDF